MQHAQAVPQIDVPGPVFDRQLRQRDRRFDPPGIAESYRQQPHQAAVHRVRRQTRLPVQGRQRPVEIAGAEPDQGDMMIAGLVVGTVCHRPAQRIHRSAALSQRVARHAQIVPRSTMVGVEQQGAAIRFGGGFGQSVVEQHVAQIVPAVAVGGIDRQQAAVAQDRRFAVAGGPVERREAQPCRREMGVCRQCLTPERAGVGQPPFPLGDQAEQVQGRRDRRDRLAGFPRTAIRPSRGFRLEKTAPLRKAARRSGRRPRGGRGGPGSTGRRVLFRHASVR